MRFNFDRSIPVSAIKLLPSGDYEVELVGRSQSITINPDGLRFTTRSKKVQDSTSYLLADLGKNGIETSEIVIAADSLYRLKTFFDWCSNIPFPGCNQVKLSEVR